MLNVQWATGRNRRLACAKPWGRCWATAPPAATGCSAIHHLRLGCTCIRDGTEWASAQPPRLPGASSPALQTGAGPSPHRRLTAVRRSRSCSQAAASSGGSFSQEHRSVGAASTSAAGHPGGSAARAPGGRAPLPPAAASCCRSFSCGGATRGAGAVRGRFQQLQQPRSAAYERTAAQHAVTTSHSSGPGPPRPAPPRTQPRAPCAAATASRRATQRRA